MLTAATQERQLQPRYRRILGFGDVLDESILLYRTHWVTFALVSAVCLIPPGVISLLVVASGAFDTRALVTDLAIGRTPSLASMSNFIVGSLSVGLLTGLFILAWTAAIVIATDSYLHGTQPRLADLIGRTLRTYPFVLIGSIVAFVGLLLLIAVSVVPFIFPLIGLLGIPVALIGFIVWLVSPRSRTTWLKWLIIVAAPFGLPTYFSGTWSMFLCATVLESHGPFGALRRSMQLVDRHWFRVVSILGISWMIVSVLQYAPSSIIQIPLSISAATRGEVGLSTTELVISTAASLILQILVAGMAAIVYAVTFNDLRNRREGTDIAERLSQLETPTPILAHE